MEMLRAERDEGGTGKTGAGAGAGGAGAQSGKPGQAGGFVARLLLAMPELLQVRDTRTAL